MKISIKNWMEKVLETPFYEAEMARAEIHEIKKKDMVVIFLASAIIVCLSLLIH